MKDSISIFGKVSTLRIFKAFHYRNFSLLFVSTIIMSVSNFMMMVALGWSVLEITDSPLSLGILWASRSAPHFIWGILAGAVADKIVGALAGLLGAQLALSINGIAIVLIFFLLVLFAQKLHRA